MALRDLLPSSPMPAPTPASERPDGVTCEHYTRGEGKRCLHYAANGACRLPSEFMCSEWLKANGPAATRSLPLAPPREPPPAIARDLFGNTVHAAPAHTAAKPAVHRAPLDIAAKSGPTPATVDIDQLRGFTSDDIESFKARGVEVLLRSDAIGELWLVPSYTGQDRKEITPENAATLLRVMAVFPGTELVSFAKPHPQPERHERPRKERS